MPTPVTLDTITRHLLEAFARVWGARLGGTAAMAPSTDQQQGDGWIVTVPVSGAATGRIIVWVDRVAAAACTKLAASLDRDAEETEVSGFLREIVIEATASLGAVPDVAGVRFAEPSARTGAAPAGLQVSYLAIANVASCLVGVGVESANPSAAESRLDAVLDVDLPLVVRFGRAVMPLRALAELGPGSVVDMGRSPDEPVELLVGERVIARGEVVVVAGNYGVRITELGGRTGGGDMEARLS
jgi:flagellar motor switch protein FliN/FliY